MRLNNPAHKLALLSIFFNIFELMIILFIYAVSN